MCILFGAKLPDATVNNWLNKALVRMSVNKLDQSNRRHFVVVYRDYTTLSGEICEYILFMLTDGWLHHARFYQVYKTCFLFRHKLVCVSAAFCGWC